MEEMKIFLNFYRQLQALLLGLLQVCCGVPARTSKVGVVQLCSTQFAARHIFIVNRHRCVITFYHKNRAPKEGSGQSILRLPDRKTPKVLMPYLLLIKPLDICLQRWPDRRYEKAGGAETDFLFTLKGLQATADALRYRFQGQMPSVGLPSGANQYPHYHAGVDKSFI